MRNTKPEEEPKGQREDQIMFAVAVSFMSLVPLLAWVLDGGPGASDIVACDLDRRGVIHMPRSTCKREGGRPTEAIVCLLPEGMVLDVAARTCRDLGGAPATVEAGR